jgi:menaquinone-specific isochorismate synthase
VSRLAVRTVELRDDRPLLALVPDQEAAVVFSADGEGLVGWGVAERIAPGPGPGRFGAAEDAFRSLAARASVDDRVRRPGTGLVALGSFTFADDDPDSVLIVPRMVVGRRAGRTWFTTIDPPGAGAVAGPRTDDPPALARDRPRYAGASNPDVHWLEAVATAIERIREGRLDKVVLARDHALWSHEPFDAGDLARRLSARFPGCYTFLVEGLVGATPELLVSRVGERVVSRVLAGTTARTHDAARDRALGAALLESAKDRWEHQLAVNSVTQVLGPRCHDLHHDDEPTVLALDNVQHLQTTVEGRLADPATSALALAAALHPTAAVGGTPRDIALATIRELEGMARDRYAAPVGWIDAAGDGEWGIALRCAELEGARARLFAGVGVVASSLPEDELAETRLKLLAMQRVLDAEPTAG